jgi:hypothetical protein
MKKTLKDTYVYKVLGLDNTVAACAKINAELDSRRVTGDRLDAILNDIKFKINYPTKIRIMDELKNGTIVFVDEPEANALPAWLYGSAGGQVRAVVNLFGKVRTGRDGQMQFNVREVFALAQIGFTIKEFYLKEKAVTQNMMMSKLAVVIYERMIYRVLDTLYSLDIGPAWLRTQVKLEIRFFATQYLLEKPDDDAIYKFVAMDLAKALGTSPEQLIAQVASSKTEGDPVDPATGMFVKYSSIPNLIKHLQNANPILKDLDTTTFLRKYIMMYGEKALLMLESYSYFLALIMSVTLSGNIVKDFGLEAVVGKEGVSMYNTFFDLTR